MNRAGRKLDRLAVELAALVHREEEILAKIFAIRLTRARLERRLRAAMDYELVGVNPS